jgi:shikimate kinase
LDDDRNIVLIGMPGVGKSTVGVLLAKATRRGFLDTDVWIQAREGRTLQAILDAGGLDAFVAMEAGHICSLDVTRCVVATGGSAVYSGRAMRHLQAGGAIVYLRAPFELLRRRVTDMATRGVVIARGQTLADLFRRRRALYERWGQLTIDCEGKTQDEIAAEIAAKLDA